MHQLTLALDCKERLRCGSKSQSTSRNHCRSAKRLRHQSLSTGTVDYSRDLEIMRAVPLEVYLSYGPSNRTRK